MKTSENYDMIEGYNDLNAHRACTDSTLIKIALLKAVKGKAILMGAMHKYELLLQIGAKFR